MNAPRIRDIMRAQAKALLWEEGRVGGMIAGTCALLGVGLLLWGRHLSGAAAWERDDFLTKFAAFWLPLIVAFLLVLNPDYAGHLTGGFSKRILRLPVTTRLAVAIALVSRTVLVAATAALLLGSARLLFYGTPGLELVFVSIAAYLLIQVVDWLRGPVSGLTSLIAIGAVALVVAWLSRGAGLFDSHDLRDLAGFSLALPVAVLVAAVASYPIAVVIVRADRAGRRYGIPEIWEWPRRIPMVRAGARSRFRSAFTAQVWFEIRRSRFVLPLVAAGVFLVILVVAWLLALKYPDSWHREDVDRGVTTLGVFAAVLFGALAHGIQTRVIGFRGAGGKPGYEYLQPLTDAQFALARVVAAAAMLLPTLAIALVIHFGVAGRVFTTEFVPDAYRLGVSAPREIAWMFLGRALLAGGLAWMLMGAGTRLFQWAAMFTFGILGPLAMADVYLSGDLFDVYGDSVSAGFAACFAIGTLILVGFALKSGRISRRDASFWIGVWAALAWLFHYVLSSPWVLETVPRGARLNVLLTSVGASSLAPLLFLAILRDISRRRHPAADVQEALPPARRPHRVAIAGAAITVAFVLWLGWPATPSYVEYRHRLGHPVTLAELDEVYHASATNRNPVSELRSLNRERNLRLSEYASWFREHKAELIGQDPSDSRTVSPQFVDYLYIAGHEPLPDSGPLDATAWRATASYWERVTATLAPRLREFTAEELGAVRFPIDLREGYMVKLDHLAPLRLLGRELHLDALHAVVTDQPDRAIDNVAAGLTLSESLANEPILISQLVRLALQEQSLRTVQLILNRAALTDAQLIRLQRIVEGIDWEQIRDGLRVSFIGESTMALDIISRFDFQLESFEDSRNSLSTLAIRLAYPVDAQRAAISLAYGHIMSLGSVELRATLLQQDAHWSEEAVDYLYRFISPAAAVLIPAYGRSWEAVYRLFTLTDIARVAIAVERFRLANHRIPASLDELVPAFLPEIPADRFDPGEGVLRYSVRDTGEYAVFSVGRNGKDETVEPRDRSNNTDDILMTVASPSVRTGPQVKKD